MKTSDILKADLLDLLFDGRNQQYGAYELRRTYDKRIRNALGGTLVVCLLFAAGSIWASGGKKLPMRDFGPIVEIKDILPPESKHEIPKPVEKQPENVKTIQFVVPKIVDNIEDQKDELPTVDDLQEPIISTVSNPDGKISDLINPPVEKGIELKTPGKDEVESKEFIPVQIPAQFPGGIDGWRKYLERNLDNEIPSRNGAPAGDYTVIISFIVDKDGSISDVKAEQDPGFGTKDEAIKVIKRGPKWIPAEQNGRKVVYRHKQSITFKVSES